MASKSGFSRRKRGRRTIKNRVVIVCEGEATEIIYFKSFQERYSNVEIRPVHEGCTDPLRIAKDARNILRKEDLDLQKGDGLWCVFDVDESTEHEIRSAVEICHAKGIQVALSNPSFELWFFLHFKFWQSSIDRSDVNQRLEKFLPDYEKANDYSNELKPRLQTAITNAQRLNNLHEMDRTELLSTKSNPSSQVFKLVEFIQEVIEKNRQK